MNRIFRVIWNHARGQYVVCDENQKSHRKSGKLKAMVATLIAASAFSSQAVMAESLLYEDGQTHNIESTNITNNATQSGDANYAIKIIEGSSAELRAEGETISISSSGTNNGASKPTMIGVYIADDDSSLTISGNSITVSTQYTGNEGLAYAIQAEGGSTTLTTNNGDITLSAIGGSGQYNNDGVYGVSATGMSIVDLTATNGGDVKIEASGSVGSMSGIYAAERSTVNAEGNSITVQAQNEDNEAFAVRVENASVTLTANANDIDLSATAADAHALGVYVIGNSSVNLTATNGDVAIKASGSHDNAVEGIYVNTAAEEGLGLTILAGGNIIVEAKNDTSNVSTINVGGGIVTLSATNEIQITENASNSNNSFGIEATGGSTVQLNAGSDVTIKATSGTGINAYSSSVSIFSSGGDILVDASSNALASYGEKSEINLVAEGGNTLKAGGNGINISLNSTTKDQAINITSYGENGNYISAAGNGIYSIRPAEITLNAENGRNVIEASNEGIYAQNSSKIYMNAQSNVITSSDIGVYFYNPTNDAAGVFNMTATGSDGNEITATKYGIQAANNVEVTLTAENGTNQITGNTYGIVAQNGASVIVSGKNTKIIGTESGGLFANGGSINVTSTGRLDLASNSYAIRTREEGAQVTVDASSGYGGNVTGDIQTYNQGKTTLKGNGLQVSSNIEAYTDGTVDIALGNGSTLTGAVNDYSEDNSYDEGAVNLTLSASDLSGSGSSASTWNVTENSSVTNLTANDSILKINYSSSDGNYHTLTTQNFSGSNNAIHLNVDIGNQENDKFVITNSVDASSSNNVLHVASRGTGKGEDSGVLVQAPNSTDSKTFSLNGGVIDEGNYLYSLVSEEDSNAHQTWLLRSTGEKSPSANAVLALAGAGVQTTQFLNSLNDLRKRIGEVRNGGEDGAYAQVRVGKEHMNGFASTGFRNEYAGITFGVDRLVAKEWIVGANIGWIESNQKARDSQSTARGDQSSQEVQLYGTWFNDKGYYADLVFTANRYDQKIRTTMLDGRGVKGDYDSWGLGFSVEGGRKINLDDQNRWFIEPQAQLSYYWTKGRHFNMSNEMDVRQDNADSLTGRLGFVVGENALKKESGYQWFFKAGVNHEFLGDATIRVNDERFYDNDMLGTRVYYGFGADWQVGKETRIYGQIEREEGAHYTGEFSARIGVKTTF